LEGNQYQLNDAYSMLAKLLLEHRPSGGGQPFSAPLEVELFEGACPKAVRNFVFLCTSHMLTPEERSERMSDKQPPPAPLSGSRVSRIDAKSGTIEFGTSASRSIFGGFFEDERSSAAPSSSSAAEGDVSGKLLLSNVGPNTNASHFVLVLGPKPPKDFDVNSFTCFGAVRRGLPELRDFAQRVKVNTSSFIPYQPVTISEAGIEYTKQAERRVIRKTTGGRRGREDDNEEENHNDDNGVNDMIQTSNSRSALDAEGAARFAKRRRGEVVAVSEDGTQQVVTTAIPQEAGEKFDVFKAQAHAFHNDLLEISAKQATRQQKRENRKGRAKTFTQKRGGGGGSSSSSGAKKTPQAGGSRKQQSGRRY
jgi:cyclophilin family peptidyl-prolyl cis-trans isomerase